MKNRPHEIVKEISELYTQQFKDCEVKGLHLPVYHDSIPMITDLVQEFEDITGKPWDSYAEDYIKEDTNEF